MQDSHIKHAKFHGDRFVVAARFENEMSFYEMSFFYRVLLFTSGKFVVSPTYAEDW